MAMLLSAVSESLAMMRAKLKRLSWCILLILKSTVNMDLWIFSYLLYGFCAASTKTLFDD